MKFPDPNNKVLEPIQGNHLSCNGLHVLFGIKSSLDFSKTDELPHGHFDEEGNRVFGETTEKCAYLKISTNHVTVLHRKNPF